MVEANKLTNTIFTSSFKFQLVNGKWTNIYGLANQKIHLKIFKKYFNKKITLLFNSSSTYLRLFSIVFLQLLFCTRKRKKKLRYLFNHNCRKPR